MSRAAAPPWQALSEFGHRHLGAVSQLGSSTKNQLNPGNEPCLIARQKKTCLPNLFNSAAAPGPLPLFDVVVKSPSVFHAGLQINAALSQDVSRKDRIHADTVLRLLNREGFGK